ncbi:MAG TPA: hypothetical protein VE710_09520, partial [Candidatus Bathyarchaeia archaeon]|nr:hypothetical protein [Candidatus Bathyarchaeia archaeon]
WHEKVIGVQAALHRIIFIFVCRPFSAFHPLIPPLPIDMVHSMAIAEGREAHLFTDGGKSKIDIM